jgi:hypothetical protein
MKLLLSKNGLIENNDLNTLRLPDNERDEDRLLVIFHSILQNNFKVKDGRHVTYFNGDKLFFESGNDLDFRGSSYFYYIRLVFGRLFKVIGKIQQAENDDPF